MNIYGYVYIRIFPNNKVYIGQTTQNPKKRWHQQNLDVKKETNSFKLHKALDKYNYNTKDYVLATLNYYKYHLVTSRYYLFIR